MTAIYQLFYYQLVSSCRSFASVFYTIFLPLMLFGIFSTFFGVGSEYAVFFLPGMIGVMSSSDALFAVGPVLKEYYRQGIVREFRSYPINITWLFSTFIFTRIIFIVISTILLCFMSFLICDYFPKLPDFIRILIGVFLNFFTYGFIAIAISLWGLSDNRDQGIISAYYFLGMFLSDAFFTLSETNIWFEVVSYFFPLRVALDFMRGDDLALVWCLVWLVVSTLFFTVQMRKLSVRTLLRS